MKNAVKGLKWGRLTITDVVTTEVWSEPNNTGVKDYVVTVSMTCACGGSFSMEEYEIDKRVHVACPTCLVASTAPGAVQEPTLRFGAVGRPRHGKFRKISYSLTMPQDIVDWLQGVAEQNRVSASAVVCGILRNLMESGDVLEMKPMEVIRGKG